MTSKETAKDARLRKIYLSSLEEHDAKIADQGGGCAICGRAFPEFSAFQDHYHGCCPRRLKTYCGKCNRGVLCYLCNKYVMGVIEKMKMGDGSPFDVARLFDYITKWKAILTVKGCYEAKVETRVKKKKQSRTRRVQKRARATRADQKMPCVLLRIQDVDKHQTIL
jgi:hypothetical protein